MALNPELCPPQPQDASSAAGREISSTQQALASARQTGSTKEAVGSPNRRGGARQKGQLPIADGGAVAGGLTVGGPRGWWGRAQCTRSPDGPNRPFHHTSGREQRIREPTGTCELISLLIDTTGLHLQRVPKNHPC